MTRYTYRPNIGLLTVKMATQMHATVFNWGRKLIDSGRDAGALKGEIELIAKGRIEMFEGEYENM